MATNALGGNQPVMQQTSSLQLGRGGLVGGGAGPAPLLQKQDTRDPTFDLLMKLGNSALAPLIKKRENELFLEGAQRIVQGEALGDIVDSQPWYSKIFGESASLQGARTVAQISQIDKYNASLMGDMENLQRLGPDEIGKVVNAKMTEFLTGDPMADAVIQQKMVESSGTFYTAHAKQHYKYTQDLMRAQHQDMMVSSAQMLGASAQQRSQGMLSDEDWDTIRGKAASTLMPLDGQSQEAYWSSIEGALVDAMVTDNHHFVKLAFESGLINEAPLEVRKSIIDERRKYENITREKAGYADFGPEKAVLKAMAANGQLSPKEVMARIDQINKQFTARYGIESPLFDRNEMTSVLTGNMKKLYSQQEANAKARMEAGRQDEMALRLATVLAAGGGNMAVHAGLGTNAEVQNGVWSATQAIAAAGGDPMEFLVETYNKGDKHVNVFMQNQMTAALRAATAGDYNGDAFQGAYQMWQGMYNKPDGKAAAQDYLGDDSLRMEKFHTLTQANVIPEVAFQMAFKEPLTKGRKVSNEEVQQKLTGTVDSIGPGFLDRLLGHSPLAPTSKGLLSQEIGKLYEPLVNNGVDEESAIARATDMVSSRVDVVGPYAYRKNPGDPSLAVLLGTDQRNAGLLLEQKIAKEAKKQGVAGGLPGTGVKFSDIGPVGAAKRLIKGEPVDLISATPGGMIKDLWNKAWGEDVGSQMVIPGTLMTDPESGRQYRTFTIYHTPADGSSPKAIVIDTRELRKEYEASRLFSD